MKATTVHYLYLSAVSSLHQYAHVVISSHGILRFWCSPFGHDESDSKEFKR